MLSVIKPSTSESVLTRRLNLEPTVKSEVGQKEEDKHRISTHTYGVQEDGTDGPLFRAAMGMQSEHTLVDTAGEREGGVN